MLFRSGALVHPHGPLVDGVAQGVRRYARADVVENVTIKGSSLGVRAGLLGAVAAVTALQRWVIAEQQVLALP